MTKPACNLPHLWNNNARDRGVKTVSLEAADGGTTWAFPPILNSLSTFNVCSNLSHLLRCSWTLSRSGSSFVGRLFLWKLSRTRAETHFTHMHTLPQHLVNGAQAQFRALCWQQLNACVYMWSGNINACTDSLMMAGSPLGSRHSFVRGGL